MVGSRQHRQNKPTRATQDQFAAALVEMGGPASDFADGQPEFREGQFP
jgi:hypothetical protein